ncbi:alpha-1,2-fucosyltransferase [Acinetobacter sp. SwsAc6]|nr:alpha-1,2-fucosyltransferase [Acinetobacter sp. SwsAc6]
MKKRNYIIVRLKGGLGNQLFQYYTAYSLAKEKNYRLVLDTCNLKNDNLRDFSLHRLNINSPIINNNYYRKFFIFFNSIRELSLPFFHHETIEYSFDENIKNINRSTILNGYYQNEKYFIKIKNEMRSNFNLLNEKIKSKDILDMIKNNNSVALHIRRGDYITDVSTHEKHGACDLSFYNQAINYFSKNNPYFFIFSDDIEWCKNNIIINGNFIFISDICNSDIEEFLLMKNCKNFIISNSTFSWWAAWLASNNDKIVICPKNWFKDQKLNTLSKELIPDSWLSF